MKKVQLFLNKSFFYLVLAMWMKDQSTLHRSRNSGRDFWWNHLRCVPVLTSISCTKLKIHSLHEYSPIVPQQVFSNLALAIWMKDQSILHSSRNTERYFWVEPAPLWGSFYTHLLCKSILRCTTVDQETDKLFGGTDHIHICVSLI